MAIQVIDLKLSNLRSVTSALEHLGLEYTIVDCARSLEMGSTIVLPGNGKFQAARQKLDETGLFEAISESRLEHAAGLLGICLGMQLMFKESDESPNWTGLGIFPDDLKFLSTNESEIAPVLGWRKVSFIKELSDFDGWYYFAHSFGANYDGESRNIAAYNYYGRPIVASVRTDKTIGFQFHPEKSGPLGLKLLGSILDHL